MMYQNELVKAGSATKAFDLLIDELMEQAENEFRCTSRDGDVVGELINPTIVISNPTRGIVTSPVRNMPMRYAVGELLWYLSGSNKTSDISKYAVKWESLSDDGETANSAYGYRIQHAYGFDQWEYVRGLLMSDKNTRQAVIHIKDASRLKTKDMPCTIALQFLLRDNELHLTTMMRSNDIWFGFPYDVFSFTALQVKMAFELGVDIGTYTHHVGSLHLYERDYYQAKTNKEKAKKDDNQ